VQEDYEGFRVVNGQHGWGRIIDPYNEVQVGNGILLFDGDTFEVVLKEPIYDGSYRIGVMTWPIPDDCIKAPRSILLEMWPVMENNPIINGVECG
jgi:hypothetical protein